MPKRSLNPGKGDPKKIEQLNQAVDAMLAAKKDGRVRGAGAEIEPLVRIAADLRNLPSASFKARLKSELRREKTYVYRCRACRSRPHDCNPKISVPRPAKAIEFYKNALRSKRKLPV